MKDGKTYQLPAVVIAPKLLAWNESQLKKHNEFRALHGVPPLVLDPDIIAAAQKWAEHLLKVDDLRHATLKERDNFGENLARWYDNTKNYKEVYFEGATKMWYDEIKDYDWNKHNFGVHT